jgi:hypothetical protein
MQQGRARQVARHAQQEVDGADRRGGERDVLGVVEYRPEPRPADRQRGGGQKAGARTRDQPRRGPGGYDAADADDSAQQMADGEDVGRQDPRQQNRNDVEQPAIEKQILVFKHRPVGQAAGVIGQDQFAIAMLDLFIVGDCVIAERCQRGHQQGRDQQP